MNESKCQQCLLVAYNCGIMTSGLKQEVSCWCKKVKLIYEDNVRRLDFMKICENNSGQGILQCNIFLLKRGL